MKQRFLLISQPNSYRIAPYLKAAVNMDLEVLIASQGKHSLITEVHAGLHIDLDNFDSALESILKAATEKPFSGILGSDDSTVELAAAAAKRLGLPHNPVEAARLSRRKDLARAHLAQANCPVPFHRLLNLNDSLASQLKGIAYPCVIKPLNLSASRGVIRANSEQELIAACNRTQKIIEHSKDGFEKTHVLIEEYIEGFEIAFEGYLHEGQLTQLTIFDKPDPLVGPFFDETIYVTPSALDKSLQQTVNDVIQQACTAYGLTTGPVHAELRIDNELKPWILEVASRTIGGDCARVLDTDTSLNLETMTIALAMGQNTYTHKHTQNYRGVMMIPIKQAGLFKRTEGLLAAKKIKYIDSIEIIIPTGHELVPLPEGNQYLGYIFSTAPTHEEVITAIRHAHKELKFITSPIINIGIA